MIYGVYVEKGREGCKLNLNYKSFLHIHTCACIYIKYFILKIQFFTPKTSLYLFFISFNKLDKCSSCSPFRALHIFINVWICSKGTLKTCLLKSLIFFFFLQKTDRSLLKIQQITIRNKCFSSIDI